jgi:hypothetical protein
MAGVDRQVSFAVEDADSFEFPAQSSTWWTMESSEHFADNHVTSPMQHPRPVKPMLGATMDRLRAK